MQRIHWKEEKPTEIDWGLGYEISKTDKATLFGHSGGFSGFTTRVAFDKDKEIGVVLLTNSIDSSAVTLSNGVFHIIYHILDNYEDLNQ